MKKMFIFALFTIILLAIGCKKEKPDYTYTCLVGYWEPIPDSKYEGASLHNSVHYSRALTKNSANFESLDLFLKNNPEAKTKDVKTYCQKYSEKVHEVELFIASGFLRGDKPHRSSANKDPKAKTKVVGKRFGCRARLQTSKGSRKSMYRLSHSATHDEAVAEMRYMYRIAYPSISNFESNCWDCELSNLDNDARIACKM